jgi:hypothetical protein
MEKTQTEKATPVIINEAVKEERDRIIKAIEAIDINTTSQINALGMKILIKEIINSKRENKLTK